MGVLRVHCVHNFRDPFRAEFDPLVSPAVSLTWGDTSASADFEVLINGRPSAEELGASAVLRTLVIPWAGLPVQTQEVLKNFPTLAVHNLHHNAAPTAEMAVSLLLTAAKDVIPIDKAIRRGDWSFRYEGAKALIMEGRTALILGYGAIGQRAARVCEALGMNVVCVRRHVPNGDSDPIRQYHPSELDELLPYANALIVTVPLTAETRGMIDARRLGLLPDGAVIVNVARGVIIDEAALFAELQSGRLRAGLDVWYNYPDTVESRLHTPPSQFPFHELPNVVMTPHLAGHSGETERLRALELAELLNAAAEGQPMPNRVNPTLGY